jgi:hypothetical protein
MSADLRERPIRKGRSKRVTMATRRRLLSRTPRAAAILVDEFDAGSFESLPHHNHNPKKYQAALRRASLTVTLPVFLGFVAPILISI